MWEHLARTKLRITQNKYSQLEHYLEIGSRKWEARRELENLFDLGFLPLSYLAHRRQSVVISSQQSDLKSIVSEVPRGNVLGSLLLNIYISDITNIYANAKFVIFADSASSFFCATNTSELPQLVDATL